MNVSEKQLPKLKKRTLSLKQKQKHNFSLGQSGETQAEAFLKQKGYIVLAKNARLGNKEIDLIAIDTEIDEVVFVEVKTRSQEFFGNPSSAVTRQKLAALRQVASAFCREKRLNKDFRFDIIAIVPGSIDHYENISWEMVK